MNRHYKNNYVKKIIAVVTVIIIFVLFKTVFIRMYAFSKQSIRNINFKMFQYKSNMQNKAKKFRDKVELVSNLDVYLNERTALLKEVEEKKLKEIIIVDLKKENEILRKNLELKQKIKLETIAAEVKLSEDNSENLIYIGKGSNDGIKEHQVVVYAGNMIGKITKVAKDYSEVTLITSKDSKTGVILNDNYLAVIRGNGNGTFSVNNYNMDIDIDKTDIFEIKTSGLSETILKDINVGTYRVKKKEHFKRTKELIFEPTYNYANLHVVLVIKEVKE